MSYKCHLQLKNWVTKPIAKHFFFLIVKEDDGISCEDQDITTQWREHFAIIKLRNITTIINTITSHGLKWNEMFEDVSITTKGVHVR